MRFWVVFLIFLTFADVGLAREPAATTGLSCSTNTDIPTRKFVGIDKPVRDTASTDRSTSNGSVNFLLTRNFNLGQEDVCQLKVTSSRKSTDDREFIFNNRGDIFINMDGEDSRPGTPQNVQVTTCQYRVLPLAEDKVRAVDSRTSGNGIVRTPSGVSWRFDTQTGKMAGPNSCEYSYKETGSKSDHCGFEISKCSGKIVIGWDAKVLNSSKDRTPASNPDSEATVRHPSGGTCKIQNKEILDYKTFASDRPVCGGAIQDSCVEPGAQTDELPVNKEVSQVKSALARKCGNLDWKFLDNGDKTGSPRSTPGLN